MRRDDIVKIVSGGVVLWQKVIEGVPPELMAAYNSLRIFISGDSRSYASSDFIVLYGRSATVSVGVTNSNVRLHLSANNGSVQDDSTVWFMPPTFSYETQSLSCELQLIKPNSQYTQNSITRKFTVTWR